LFGVTSAQLKFGATSPPLPTYDTEDFDNDATTCSTEIFPLKQIKRHA
jgi:hypothetical protein